jgi:hypothetical protein
MYDIKKGNTNDEINFSTAIMKKKGKVMKIT